MNLFNSNKLINKQIAQICLNSVRFRRPGKSPAQSQGAKYREKYYGLKGLPGCFCNEKEVIATQNDSRFHPGLNTGVDPRDGAIYAICAGTLAVTTEKFDHPNFDHPFVEKHYKDFKGPMYKRYINVIPFDEKPEFKLIDLV